MDDYKRNKTYIAQGCLTNSKHERTHIQGVYPRLTNQGSGSVLVGSDGKEYIDFICGLGTNLFGYGNQKICMDISMALSRGISHSLPTKWEGIAAERLTELFPWVEKFKFLCTGSEVCASAIKMARAYTGRMKVLSAGYHGHLDPFVSLTPPASGVPHHDSICLLNSFDQICSGTAAVIIEPIITDTSEKRIEWLRALQKKCHDNGVILIFDEVITGFRYADYSVSHHHKIYPDLICLGKAMGSGIPIAAVAGRADILDGDYFVSSTNAGSVAGLAAAIAAVDLLMGCSDYRIDRLWESGQFFMNRFNKMCEDIQIEGYPTRGSFTGDPHKIALLFQEACKSGILFGPSWFFNFGHVADMDTVLDSCESILARIGRNEIELEGKMPSSPFAEKVRCKS